MARLALVTATTDRHRAEACIASWIDRATDPPEVEILFNGGQAPYLGTVPAFRRAMDTILERSAAEVIACLHDDLEIVEDGWDQKVLRHFDRQPACGLAGFGGAIGLGSDQIYQDPYDPMQLARIGFRSNLRDAEAHGMRLLFPCRVACLDGFSQIGRRRFWEGLTYEYEPLSTPGGRITGRGEPPWQALESLGIVHHCYDAALGALAKRYDWEVWYLPVACHHYGGRTAVGDSGYGDWARTQHPHGDQGFWETAHRICYDHFRDTLPIRV